MLPIQQAIALPRIDKGRSLHMRPFIIADLIEYLDE
jgi:hypothetical protein